MLAQLRNTSNDKITGALRILLGLAFFMAGILKVVVPQLGEAFSGQLIAANIPFHSVSLYAFPVVEMVLGFTLLFRTTCTIIRCCCCSHYGGRSLCPPGG